MFEPSSGPVLLVQFAEVPGVLRNENSVLINAPAKHSVIRFAEPYGRPADASHGLPGGCVSSGWALANMLAARNAPQSIPG